MTDAVKKTLKNIAQVAVETAKADFVVNEKSRRQTMEAGYQNAIERVRSQNGGPSLREPVFKWSVRDKYMELKKL